MVIHLDLKPANILFLTDQSGMLNTIKIIDFGVAISLNPDYATDLFENKTVGTLNYMAPEQLIGKECYESDVYSVGAIMYTILAGRVPLSTEQGKNIKEKLRLIYRGNRTPILEANANLKAEPALVELSRIIDQMLALDPEGRLTVEELQLLVHFILVEYLLLKNLEFFIFQFSVETAPVTFMTGRHFLFHFYYQSIFITVDQKLFY